MISVGSRKKGIEAYSGGRAKIERLTGLIMYQLLGYPNIG